MSGCFSRRCSKAFSTRSSSFSPRMIWPQGQARVVFTAILQGCSTGSRDPSPANLHVARLLGEGAPMTYRVVQWTTGKTGTAAVRGIVAHPDLELVGCYAWSADKVGQDAGTLSGIDPVGVLCTDDID